MGLKSLTVVIPTMHRTDDLSQALKSLGAQTRIPDEIVIVDQSTDDSTERCCREFNASGALQGRIRYFYQAEPSSARARNTGIIEAQGDVVSFLDDDVVLLQDYYEQIESAFDRYQDVGAIGGSVLNTGFGGARWTARKILMRLLLLNSWSGRMTASGFGYPIYDRAITKIIEVEMLHGCNANVRRELLKHDKFDEWFSGYSFREDAELTYRISKKAKVIMIPEARLFHNESPKARLATAERKRMELLNYAYVWQKHCGTSLRSRILFSYSLGGLLLLELLGAIKNAPYRRRQAFRQFLETLKEALNLDLRLRSSPRMPPPSASG